MKLAQLDFYQAAQDQKLPGVTSEVVNSSDRGFGTFLGNILSGVMVVAALLLLLYLIWGAFDWLTSGGDSGKITKARDKMTQSVIGMIVLASTLALFFLIQSFLGLNILNNPNVTAPSKDFKNSPFEPTTAPVRGVPAPTRTPEPTFPANRVPIDGAGLPVTPAPTFQAAPIPVRGVNAPTPQPAATFPPARSGVGTGN